MKSLCFVSFLFFFCFVDYYYYYLFHMCSTVLTIIIIFLFLFSPHFLYFVIPPSSEPVYVGFFHPLCVTMCVIGSANDGADQSGRHIERGPANGSSRALVGLLASRVLQSGTRAATGPKSIISSIRLKYRTGPSFGLLNIVLKIDFLLLSQSQ